MIGDKLALFLYGIGRKCCIFVEIYYNQRLVDAQFLRAARNYLLDRWANRVYHNEKADICSIGSKFRPFEKTILRRTKQ